MPKYDFDVIIIGGGVAASVTAYNLSQSKLKIACFEQGYFEKNSSNYKKKKLSFFDYKKMNINPNLRKLESDYLIDDSESDISIANFNALGGSSVLYSAHLPRFLPKDFKEKISKKVFWPITYYDLKKYYDLNEKILGVAGLTGDKTYPDKIRNLMPPIKLGAAIIKITKAFDKLNWHWWPSYSGVVTSKKDKRGLGTITEPNNSYWPMAIKNKVKIFLKSKVIKILCDKNNNATGIKYLNSKKQIKKKTAKIIILASGGLGTPRILLNSKSKNFPNGIANSSGMVGKNLMLHPLGWVEGKFSKFLKSYDGPQGCSIASSQFLTQKNKNFQKGYLIQILREPHPVEQSVIKNKLRKLNFGKKFFDNFFDFYGKTVSAAIICEDLPETKNRLILEQFKKNQNEIPNIKIKYKLSDNSKKMIAHGIKNSIKLMKLAGAKDINSFGPVKHTGWHIMGTARMGVNKKNSVVNKNGRCHDINNLFIVDSSIFTSSSGVNPVSTICALSFKISDYIKENFYEKFS